MLRSQAMAIIRNILRSAKTSTAGYGEDGNLFLLLRVSLLSDALSVPAWRIPL